MHPCFNHGLRLIVHRECLTTVAGRFSHGEHGGHGENWVGMAARRRQGNGRSNLCRIRCRELCRIDKAYDKARDKVVGVDHRGIHV